MTLALVILISLLAGYCAGVWRTRRKFRSQLESFTKSLRSSGDELAEAVEQNQPTKEKP
jgi:hypothetical protein